MKFLLQTLCAISALSFTLPMSIINRRDDPPAPEVANLTVTSTRSIYISWNPLLPAPQGIELVGIIVYTKEAGGSAHANPVSPNSIDLPLLGLSPGTSQEVWVCALYDSGIGEICSGHLPFYTQPEQGPPPNNGAIPFISNIRANDPYSITVEIQSADRLYDYYAVVIESNSGYHSNTRFDNPDKVGHMTVQVNDLPLGTEFTVWVEGCKVFIFNYCSGPSPTKTVETPCIPNACLYRYVWREATAGDIVCVTTQVRSDAKRDNERADSRKEPGGGQYGPDTCKQGFVWREATPNDHVCVTPETKELTKELNHSAHERVNPKCAA